ncbi:MAG: hypothetical protein HKN91_00620 [Acidimicrobiia bacterium]|nr:hypothetical protein [Acidimicrobiia bacterium]
MTDVMVELRAANPAPAESEPHPTAWSDAALLAAIDTRSGTDMSLDQKQKTERANAAEGPRKWNRGLVAATAFAVVIAVIGVVSVIGGNTPPTTTNAPSSDPTTTEPTTTAAPVTTLAVVPTTSQRAVEVPPETQVLLDNYVDVYNSGDTAAWAALHAPGTVRVASAGDDTWNSDLEEQAEIYDFFLRIGQTIDLVDCEVSVATGIAWCKAFRTDDLTRAAGIEDWTLLGLRFTKGEIIEWRENFSGPNLYLSAMAGFGQWMSDTHPQEPPLVTIQGDDFIYTPENADRARDFLRLWGESLDGATG